MVEDGTTSILIAMNASITRNSVMLQGMIVTLTNIVHPGEELLDVTGIATEPNITLVRYCNCIIFTQRSPHLVSLILVHFKFLLIRSCRHLMMMKI